MQIQDDQKEVLKWLALLAGFLLSLILLPVILWQIRVD